MKKFETGYPLREDGENPSENLKGELKKNILQKIRDAVLQNKLIHAGIIASALHAPIERHVGTAMTRIAEAAHDVWERAGMVITPQSPEKMKSVQDAISKREKTIDQKALAAYKEKTEKQIELGREPSLKELQLELERLNGVSEADVQQADKKYDELIARYILQVEGDIDKAKLDRLSREMYGGSHTYAWDQASAVRYANSGEYNCVAIATAENIVIEGILSQLPPNKRSHWRQGTQMVKQHVIATIEHLDDAGNSDMLYKLEDGVTEWKMVDENGKVKTEPGTVNISQDIVKKAAVSSTPIEVQAAGKKGEVKPSPDIHVITDEPAGIFNNIHVNGDLKGSHFVEEQTKKEGIEPRQMTEREVDIAKQKQIAIEKILQEQNKPMEVEIDMEQGAHVAENIVRRDISRGNNTPLLILPGSSTETAGIGSILSVNSADINARELTNPTVEAIQVFGTPRDNEVYYNDMSGWSDESIDQAFKNHQNMVSIQSLPNGNISDNVLSQLIRTGRSTTTKKLQIVAMAQEAEYIKPSLDTEQLRSLLKSDAAHIYDLSQYYSYPTKEDIEIIVENLDADHSLMLDSASVSVDHAEVLAKTKGKVFIHPGIYKYLIEQDPALLDTWPHLSFNGIQADRLDLFHIAQIVHRKNPHHPLNAVMRSWMEIYSNKNLHSEIEYTKFLAETGL